MEKYTWPLVISTQVFVVISVYAIGLSKFQGIELHFSLHLNADHKIRGVQFFLKDYNLIKSYPCFQLTNFPCTLVFTWQQHFDPMKCRGFYIYFWVLVLELWYFLKMLQIGFNSHSPTSTMTRDFELHEKGRRCPRKPEWENWKYLLELLEWRSLIHIVAGVQGERRIGESKMIEEEPSKNLQHDQCHLR